VGHYSDGLLGYTAVRPKAGAKGDKCED